MRADRDRERALDVRAERLDVLRLVIERLHDLDVPKRLADVAADAREFVLARARQRAHAAAEQHDRCDDDRCAREHDQRQLRIARNEQHDAADEHQQVAQRDRHRRTDHGLQQRRVGGDARLDLGRQILFEESGVQMHEVIEHRAPQIRADALADPRHEVEARVRADASAAPPDSANTSSECSSIPGAPLVKPASITSRTPCPIDSVTDAVTTSASDAPTTCHRYGARYRSAAVRLPSLRLD